MFYNAQLRKNIAVFQEFSERRAKRLLQLSIVCFLGMGVAAVVSVERFIAVTLVVSMIFMVASGWLAANRRVVLSATALLINLTVMLSVLVFMTAGIYDIAMLGYPMILLMAAVLGNLYLFLGLLLSILAYITVIGVMTVQGAFIISIPTVQYAQVIYANLMLIVVASAAYMLIMDVHGLLTSLKEENQRVVDREQMISRLANLDQLTDLYNRRYAEFHFAEFLEKAVANQQQVALIFLDLDNFKPVNDSLGHAAGDQVLRRLSQRLLELAAPDDIVCRFGGDEFLWIKAVPKERGTQSLAKDAQAVLDAASLTYFIMENKIELSGSVGIAVASKSTDTFLELSRAADLAMYHAKSKGRNTYSFYNEELNRINVDKYQLLKKMREGLAKHEFEVHYQPKIDLKTRKIISCEALVRWRQADGSYIYPDLFIPLAESSGLIAELGTWVLVQACLDCAAWQAEGYQVGVAVNVSYVQFKNGSLPEIIEHALSNAKLDAKYLEIELTESLLINDEDDIQQQLDELNKKGVHLAIDDFGTGYSNLGYLRQFNARCLKIDKSFITQLGANEHDIPLVKAMVQMANSLGLTTIAEGIEDQETMQKLINLGCDEGQGYLWSAARNKEQWLEFLAENYQSVK